MSSLWLNRVDRSVALMCRSLGATLWRFPDHSDADPIHMNIRLKKLEKKWKRLRKEEGFRQAPVLTLTRLVSWLARCLLQKATIVNLRRWKIQMFLPPKWRGIGRLIFTFREHYEPELAYLEKVLSSGKTFVDVGASFGIY